jgi:predicted O-methyltransferase YrrM
MADVTPDGVNCHTAGRQYGHGQAVEVETGMFLYGLVRRFHPRCVVETGTHLGFGTSWVACALKDNVADYSHHKVGHIYTIDVLNHDNRADELWDKLGVRKFVSRFVCRGDAWPIDLHAPIDLLWLDADHSAESIVTEFEHFKDFLADECLIVFHDTTSDVRMDAGVREIERRLVASGAQTSRIALRNMRGLDLIQTWKAPLGPRWEWI